jgi:peroxiredoxin
MNSKCNCHENIEYYASIPAPDAWDQRISTRIEETGDPFILFHFVCRWTCSRCWKRALILNRSLDRLKKRDIAVVMVGPSQHIREANRLAKGLRLKVTLLADDWHSLGRSYTLSSQIEFQHGESLVLVDKFGIVRYRENRPEQGSPGRLVEFINSIDCPSDKQSGCGRFSKSLVDAPPMP